MATTAPQDVKHEARQRGERRRAGGERRLQRAITAERRLSAGRGGRRRPVGHEPDPRFAYLMRSHD